MASNSLKPPLSGHIGKVVGTIGATPSPLESHPVYPIGGYINGGISIKIPNVPSAYDDPKYSRPNITDHNKPVVCRSISYFIYYVVYSVYPCSVKRHYIEYILVQL